MALPPLEAFARCMTNFDHLVIHEDRQVTLPQSGATATVVRLSGWAHTRVGGMSDRWQETDRITAVHRWTPELIGRSAGWSLRLREGEPNGIRPSAEVPVSRDKALLQALLDRGVGDLLSDGPLGHRTTRQSASLSDQVDDDGIGLDYRAGHLVARVRSDETGDAEIAHLEAIADRVLPLLDELAPPPEPVDAVYGPDKPRDIAPGAETVEQARDLLQGPKRFLRGREDVSDEAALSGFAASYAAARGFRSEFAPHADLELPRYGVPARVSCSVLATLADGRAARLANTTGWRTFAPGEGRVPVTTASRDVAVVALSAEEVAALGAGPHRDDAWIAGSYLVVARPGEWQLPSAASFDALLASAGEILAGH